MIEQDESQDAVWNRIVLGGAGACQGALFYGLAEHWPAAFEPTTLVALRIFIGITPLVFFLLVRRPSWLKDMMFCVGAGLVAALLYKASLELLGFAEGGSRAYGGAAFSLAFAVTGLLILVIPIVFYQTARGEERFAFPYRQLFLNAWTNKLVVLVAAFFLGINWLVLALWGGLFKLIDVEFFARLFVKPWFIWIYSCAMFGLGVALSRERPAIIQALLKLVLTLFRVLAPILAGVILLFLAALPLTGLEALWDTGIASRILLSVVFLFIVFQNTVIQAGESDNTFWKPAEWMVMAANAVMPVLAILAGSAILLRVGQYGWSPARFYMALLTGVALAYGLAYAGSVIVWRGAWMGGVVRFNPILALGMLTLAILMHLPPIEPYGISARDQLARLRDGRISPEKFDFAFLKFKLGKAGRDVLTEIETDEALAKRPLVVEGLASIKDLKSYSRYWQRRRDTKFAISELHDVVSYMDIFPPNQAPPAAAVEEWVNSSRFQFQNCKTVSNLRRPRCVMMMIDLNGDGLGDMALLSGSTGLFTRLRQSDGGWKAGPYLRAVRPPRAAIKRSDLTDAIKRGDIRLVPHETQNVMIGGTRFK